MKTPLLVGNVKTPANCVVAPLAEMSLVCLHVRPNRMDRWFTRCASLGSPRTFTIRVNRPAFRFVIDRSVSKRKERCNKGRPRPVEQRRWEAKMPQVSHISVQGDGREPVK